MWKFLSRDPLLRVLVLLIPFLVGPYYVLEGEAVRRFDLYADLPVLVLAMVVSLREAFRSGRLIERRFWSLIGIAWSFWLVVRLLNIVIREEWAWDHRLAIITDALYIAFYFCIILALELKPSRRGDGSGALHTLTVGGTLIFLIGLVTYFVAVPALLDREAYDSWLPSFILYVVLDLYMVGRLASLLYACESQSWRRVYGLMLIGATLWLAADTLDVLASFEIQLSPLAEQVWDLLWLPPFMAFIAAARVGKMPEVEVLPEASTPPLFVHSLWGGPLVVFAVAFPTIHFAADALEVAGSETNLARQATVLVVLAALCGMAVFYQKTLERENIHLRAERLAVNEQIKLAERMESVGRLAGGVAHDFNNLLQVIQLCNDGLLLEMKPGSKLRHNAEQIRMAADRAAELTDHLLAFSLRKSIEPRPLVLNEVVEQMASMVHRVIGDDIELETQTSKEVGVVNVDRGQLERSLLNLVVNSRDAMPGGGRLTICTFREVLDPEYSRLHGGERRGPFAVIEVKDSGSGIEAEVHDLIFEPFFTTKPQGKGTGLGLSMVYGFAAQSGGHIDVESKPDDGSTFRIYLPMVDGKPATVAKDPAPGVSHLGGSEAILVVENEIAVRSVVCAMLEDWGYEVLEAANGRIALELLRSRPGGFDLVLSDVVMPEMGGFELARRMHEVAPSTRLLFMTGHAGNEATTIGGDLVSVPTLQKPFSHEHLARRVRDVLSDAQPQSVP